MKKIGLKKGPFYHPNLPAEHRLSEMFFTKLPIQNGTN
ncbi:hypothetical protein LEP1GSC059_4478 [Leptospira noguchii serovar Panama str. CZ214]|uniref:Uncharacterized protein n=1 Tax=Leptospira noguchii serovar Panama str. CZ214 TaxID=1001595 RepID=T0GT56_9LEPT|nr:hypothetical protein LEP1GSC059_4478 [Leptospira noguchii serovar Panama str. CZ214]